MVHEIGIDAAKDCPRRQVHVFYKCLRQYWPMAPAVRESSIGRGDDRFGISFPYSKSGISDDVRLLERRTAAAIIPRHL